MSEEVFINKKFKKNAPWMFVISDRKSEGIDATFHKKELQKAKQKEFRIEKVIKGKGNKLYVKG